MPITKLADESSLCNIDSSVLSLLKSERHPFLLVDAKGKVGEMFGDVRSFLSPELLYVFKQNAVFPVDLLKEVKTLLPGKSGIENKLAVISLNIRSEYFKAPVKVMPVQPGDCFVFVFEKSDAVSFDDITPPALLAKRDQNPYRAMVDHSPYSIFLTKPDGTILEANAAACNLFGYTADEFRNIGRSALILEDDPGFRLKMAERRQKGNAVGELIGIRKDGTMFPMEFSSVIFKNEHGEERTSTIVADISLRKKNEEQIGLANQQMQMILDNTEQIFLVLDQDLRIRTFNKVAQRYANRLLGTSFKTGQSIMEFVQQDRIEVMRSLYQDVLNGNPRVSVFESDGGYGVFSYRLHYTPIKGRDNLVTAIMINAHDITVEESILREILRKHELLEQAETNYREIFEKANEGIFIYDVEAGKLVDANNKGCLMLAATREEILKKPELYLNQDGEFTAVVALERLELALKEGPQLFEWNFHRKDGEILWVEVSLTKATIAGSEKVLVFLRNINDRKKAEEQKEFERRDKEALINSTRDLVWSLDTEHRLLAANTPFLQLLERLAGIKFQVGDHLKLTDTFPKEHIEYWKSLYTRAFSGEIFSIESSIVDQESQSEVWAEITFNPIYHNDRIMGIACYSRDITENKKSREQILNINNKLETAQKIARLGYWEVGFNLEKLFWTKEVYDIWEADPETYNLSFDKFYSTIHPDDRPEFDTVSKDLFIVGKALDFVHRIVLPGGKVKYIHEKGNVIRDEHGTPLRLEGTAQDITEMRENQIRLQESRKQLEATLNGLNKIMNCSLDIICTLDRKGRFIQVSEASTKVLGYTPEELLGRSYLEFVLPEDHQSSIQTVAEIMSGISKTNFENRYVRKDGTVIPVVWSARWDFDDKIMYCIAKDATQKKQAEKVLRDSREMYLKLFHESPLPKWIHDLDSLRILEVNEAAITQYGYSKKEFIGKHVFDIVADKESQEKLDLTIVGREAGTIHFGQLTYETATGERLFVEVYGNVVDFNGRRALMTMPINVTDVVISRQMLEQRAKELIGSNEELERFAYVASHDLQEPLRVMTSFLKLLKLKYQHTLDEDAEQYIAYAMDGAERMKQLILDLLNYSRIGSAQPVHEPVDLNNLVTETLALFTDEISESNAIIMFQDLPSVVGTRRHLVQLFQNLIGNALKYKSADTPLIKIESTETKTHWCFTVSDNGVGIDPKHEQKIFVIFQRLHNRDQYSGTGIGLAIVKKVIEKHGGEIGVRPNYPKGSVFYFSLKK